MEVNEAIERRRTIRTFSKDASEEQLRRIILAGTKAPSGGNSQPWEFIIVDDPATVERLAELKYRLNRKFRPRKGEGQKEVEERALNQKKSFQTPASLLFAASRRANRVLGYASRTCLWLQ